MVSRSRAHGGARASTAEAAVTRPVPEAAQSAGITRYICDVMPDWSPGNQDTRSGDLCKRSSAPLCGGVLRWVPGRIPLRCMRPGKQRRELDHSVIDPWISGHVLPDIECIERRRHGIVTRVCGNPRCRISDCGLDHCLSLRVRYHSIPFVILSVASRVRCCDCHFSPWHGDAPFELTTRLQLMRNLNDHRRTIAIPDSVPQANSSPRQHYAAGADLSLQVS